jgi:S-adenosylmethionine:diacylglycerol 3-amino-3-carboxypropyl transferase
MIDPHGNIRKAIAEAELCLLMEKAAKIGVYPISDKSWLDTGQLEELYNTLKRLFVD